MKHPDRYPGGFVLGLLLIAGWSVALAESVPARATDAYDAAVAQPGRTSEDRERDAIDHPAQILRLAGIRPGMQVADILAADGYYSELLSHLVGPRGHVLLVNNAAYEKWVKGSWAQRLAGGRLPNVEHRQAELERMHLGERSLDAVLLIKVYHDFYWTDPEAVWPAVNVPVVLDEIARAVKPGGIVLLVDHSAVAGTGTGDAVRIHRIDEQFARHDFESRGFTVVASSDVLRHPEDRRDEITYKGPMLGKTDRFVLVLRKNRR